MTFSITISYLRSLLLAMVLSFVTPIALIGAAIVLLLAIGVVPGFVAFGQACATQFLAFLETFGNGSAWEGVLVIGSACAVVGGLFDTYIFTITTSADKFQSK